VCGICGFIGPATGIPSLERPAVLKAMMDTIVHRGPDDAGEYLDGTAALGFRRLSIIDLDNGHQPMANETGDVYVTFNGEIYNHLELRAKLAAKGHTFANSSDTEVLVHAWEEYGPGMLDLLRGMFAFIIWDARTNTAFGARDFFGIKPFYYAVIDSTLVYASEIKAILAYPGYERAFNHDALEQYLSFQYSVLPQTFFKGIYKLNAGEYLEFRDGALATTRYFYPLPSVQPAEDLATAVDKVADAMQESVQAHMIADVEVGSLLSSGIDSSYITALYPNERTFTVGFETSDGVKYNEISYAQRASAEMGKANRSRVIAPADYWESIPRIMYHMDEPLADPSAVALFFLDELVAEDVKVVLSGEGADEFFGGYPIYHEPLSLAGYQRLPRFLRRGLGALARALPLRIKGRGFLIRGSMSVEERFIGNAYLFGMRERDRLLKRPQSGVKPEDLTAPYYAQVAQADDIAKMQYIDCNFWLIGDILLKADKMAMAHSLESRVPFLDRKVFALSRTLPVDYRYHGTTAKYVLREAASRVLPTRVAQKPKLGFPVPMRVWLKEDAYYNRVKALFTGEDAQRFFNTNALVALLDEHRAGREDNSRKVWAIYVFLIWYDVFFGQGHADTSVAPSASDSPVIPDVAPPASGSPVIPEPAR